MHTPWSPNEWPTELPMPDYFALAYRLMALARAIDAHRRLLGERSMTASYSLLDPWHATPASVREFIRDAIVEPWNTHGW